MKILEFLWRHTSKKIKAKLIKDNLKDVLDIFDAVSCYDYKDQDDLFEDSIKSLSSYELWEILPGYIQNELIENHFYDEKEDL